MDEFSTRVLIDRPPGCGPSFAFSEYRRLRRLPAAFSTSSPQCLMAFLQRPINCSDSTPRSQLQLAERTVHRTNTPPRLRSNLRGSIDTADYTNSRCVIVAALVCTNPRFLRRGGISFQQHRQFYRNKFILLLGAYCRRLSECSASPVEDHKTIRFSKLPTALFICR